VQLLAEILVVCFLFERLGHKMISLLEIFVFYTLRHRRTPTLLAGYATQNIGPPKILGSLTNQKNY